MDPKLQQRLYIAIILLGLLPTIGVFGWGVLKSFQSHEIDIPAWVSR